MKFAVIGSAHGHIYEFIEDMLSFGGEFTGVYDDHSELVGPISQKYSVPIFKDIKELLQSDITVAGTSAVNSIKMDIIEACSNYGVHVLADKPIAVNEDQYDRLLSVIKQGKIEVGMMLTVRFMPPAWTIKKLIDKGRIGQLICVEIFSPHKLNASARPKWHFDREQNGGIVIDLMIHNVDLFHWLTDSEITDYEGVVVKSIQKDKASFNDSTQFFVNSSQGVTGYFRVDWHMTDSHWNWGDLRIFCTGTTGCLEARVTGDPLTKEAVVILYEEGKATCEAQLEECNSTVTRDFMDRIQGKVHVITHQDILSASRNVLDFDIKAKKINIE